MSKSISAFIKTREINELTERIYWKQTQCSIFNSDGTLYKVQQFHNPISYKVAKYHAKLIYKALKDLN